MPEMEEEELMLGSLDERQAKKVRSAWKKATAAPPVLKPSIDETTKLELPGHALRISIAKLEADYKALDKEIGKIFKQHAKKAAATAKAFEREYNASKGSRIPPAELPSRKTMLISKGMEVDALCGEMVSQLSVAATRNIRIQNTMQKCKRDLAKAFKDAKKEKDKKKPIDFTVMGTAVQLKVGELMALKVEADNFATELGVFDTKLSKAISSWQNDKNLIQGWIDKIRNFQPGRINS